MKIQKISFDTILPYWQILWPNRKSIIKEVSSMTYLGGYDMNIYSLYSPTFFGLFLDNNIIGVNSGHKTSNNFYRSRGLWVDTKFRGKNLSSYLLSAAEQQAIYEKCNYIWSIPRKKALNSYLKNGYLQTSNFFDQGMEFGPNCYTSKDL